MQSLIISMDDLEDPAEALKGVKINPKLLKYVPNKTPEICITAVNLKPSAIRFVEDLSMLL